MSKIEKTCIVYSERVYQIPLKQKEAGTMRSIEEQMIEIQRRKFVYAEQKGIHRMTGLAAGLCLLLIGVLVFAPGVIGSSGSGGIYFYGATILGPEVGGYVIVAILAFALGIIVTILIQKKRRIDENTRKVVKV